MMNICPVKFYMKEHLFASVFMYSGVYTTDSINVNAPLRRLFRSIVSSLGKMKEKYCCVRDRIA